VLDRNNRAHDVSNLYVVDASFFPSSGGTNPTLTIAANALRVAGSIEQTLSERPLYLVRDEPRSATKEPSVPKDLVADASP